MTANSSPPDIEHKGSNVNYGSASAFCRINDSANPVVVHCTKIVPAHVVRVLQLKYEWGRFGISEAGKLLIYKVIAFIVRLCNQPVAGSSPIASSIFN